MRNNPSKLWLFVVMGFVLTTTLLVLSIAGKHYGLGPLAATATPTSSITPTPEATATPMPTKSAQPEVVSRLEAATGGVFDITAIGVDADSIYVVILQTVPLPKAIDIEAFDAAILGIISSYYTGSQSSVVAMYLAEDLASGEFYIAWVNTCAIADILESGAWKTACKGNAVHVVIHDSATLRWLNR